MFSGGSFNNCFSTDLKQNAGTHVLESQSMFVHEPLMDKYRIPVCYVVFQNKLFHKPPRSLFWIPDSQQMSMFSKHVS